MKDREEITALVCRPHCRFYRPGEKEEMSCAGYDFIARRISDKLAARLVKKFEDAAPPKVFEHDPRIEAILCRSCPFQAEDCDFMGEDIIENAVPCGGYVLIKRFLEAGVSHAKDWLDAKNET